MQSPPLVFRRGDPRLSTEEEEALRRLRRVLEVFSAVDAGGLGHLREFDVATGLTKVFASQWRNYDVFRGTSASALFQLLQRTGRGRTATLTQLSRVDFVLAFLRYQHVQVQKGPLAKAFQTVAATVVVL